MKTLRVLALGVITLIMMSHFALGEGDGKTEGTFQLDAMTATLKFASCYEVEGLFDSNKKDTVIVLTDAALGELAPTDEWELGQSAQRGERVVLALRIDGTKLLNVRVNHQSVKGTMVLPGQWFTYKAGKANSGSLSLAKHEHDGHSYSCTARFSATPYVAAPPPVEKEETPKAPEPEATPAKPPETPSTIDTNSLKALFIAAMMQKDEAQALAIFKQGVNPNARDQYGIPVLSWAVMMCMPKVVQALVDAKADLTYQRSPGLTILMEAGACPEAEKILRAAGAK